MEEGRYQSAVVGDVPIIISAAKKKKKWGIVLVAALIIIVAVIIIVLQLVSRSTPEEREAILREYATEYVESLRNSYRQIEYEYVLPVSMFDGESRDVSKFEMCNKENSFARVIFDDIDAWQYNIEIIQDCK